MIYLVDNVIHLLNNCDQEGKYVKKDIPSAPVLLSQKLENILASKIFIHRMHFEETTQKYEYMCIVAFYIMMCITAWGNIKLQS